MRGHAPSFSAARDDDLRPGLGLPKLNLQGEGGVKKCCAGSIEMKEFANQGDRMPMTRELQSLHVMI